MPGKKPPDFFFDKWSNEMRASGIRHSAKLYEKEPAVIKKIDELLTHFSICSENRNHLLHSHISADGKPQLFNLEKFVRGGENHF
jgi:hypothetical protein